jgi:hypothetical protein
MPLPSFEDYPAVWIEKTKSSHHHGGPGWEFGTCLWSPTRSKTGQQIYKNMQRAGSEDLVLHFYKDTPFGRDEDYYFCGVSKVIGPAKILDTEPPQPGDWAGRSQYFRIDVEGFVPFTDPISISQFIEMKGAALFNGPPGDEPSFVLNDGRVRLAQGKYLASCPKHLYELLSSTVEGTIEPAKQQPASKPKPGKEAPPKPFDYEEYVEGQRAKRETNYFVRNPQLVRDAKTHFGAVCQACNFRYPERYLDLGEGYIEVHHLNPLSEQSEAGSDQKLSKLSQVTALCANCHRMIHRLIRKEKRPVTLEEFRKYVVEG